MNKQSNHLLKKVKSAVQKDRQKRGQKTTQRFSSHTWELIRNSVSANGLKTTCKETGLQEFHVKHQLEKLTGAASTDKNPGNAKKNNNSEQEFKEFSGFATFQVPTQASQSTKVVFELNGNKITIEAPTKGFDWAGLFQGIAQVRSIQ